MFIIIQKIKIYVLCEVIKIRLERWSTGVIFFNKQSKKLVVVLLKSISIRHSEWLLFFGLALNLEANVFFDLVKINRLGWKYWL